MGKNKDKKNKKKKVGKGKLGTFAAHPMVREILDEIIAAALIAAAAKIGSSASAKKTVRSAKTKAVKIVKDAEAAVGAKPKRKTKAKAKARR